MEQNLRTPAANIVLAIGDPLAVMLAVLSKIFII